MTGPCVYTVAEGDPLTITFVCGQPGEPTPYLDDTANLCAEHQRWAAAFARRYPPVIDRSGDSDFECALTFAPLFYDTPEGL